MNDEKTTLQVEIPKQTWSLLKVVLESRNISLSDYVVEKVERDHDYLVEKVKQDLRLYDMTEAHNKEAKLNE
ncbi:MAG: hypothetical protein DDT23_01062 [candidate division WS2 bacterium]|nr:hypothetical protein [Candidatus Lithacetigena glycinireducens]